MPKPRKGEGKQQYLKRCVEAQRAAGTADAKAFSICAGNWKDSQLADADADTARLTCPVSISLADPVAADGDAVSRFAMLAYTGKIVDWGWWRFIIDLKGIEAKATFPSLREHARDRVVGVCDSWKVDANGMHVFGRFSASTPDALEVLALAREEYPWQSSVGIRALGIDFLEKGQTRKVNGQTVEGPIEIWTRSVVQEVSFVSLGADDDTAAITMSSPTEDEMNKRLKSLLVRMGLAESATDEEALAFLASLGDDGAVLSAACGVSLAGAPMPGRDGGDPTPVAPAADLANPHTAAPGDVKAAVEAALAADRQRVRDIFDLCAKLHLPEALARELTNNGASIEMARSRAIEEIGKLNPHAGGMDLGMDESDKFRALASEGMLMRSGMRIEKPQDASREFRGMSLVDFARLCLERGGFSTRGLSAASVAERILSRGSLELSASVSDFKSIFLEVAHRRLLSAYTETPQTWRPIVNIVTASDFKDIYGIALSEAPDLELVGERGEYKTGDLKDKQESYRIGKYGRILTLSREMIVNDDLRAFARIPQLLGAAASRKTSDIVWGLLLSNPTMKDGKALFHAERANLEATAELKTPVSSAGLSSGRKSMRKRKGLKGARIDVQPQFLVIPVEQETSAEVLLRSIALPEANMSGGVHNPWANKLTPIAEPRLDDVSTKAWYLVASPSQVDTIEVAFMDGNEAPTITEDEQFRTDALAYKARIEFGAGVMDTVGFFKNAGE